MVTIIKDTSNNSDILNNLTIYNIDEVFEYIKYNWNNNNVNPLLFQFIKKLPSLDISLEKIILKILNYIQDYDNNSSIYISLLEILNRKRDNIIKLRVIEELSKIKLSQKLIMEILRKPEIYDLLVEILMTNEGQIEEFLLYGIQSTDLIVMKNMSEIILKLPIYFFKDYKTFKNILYNEYYGMRNSFLEIIQNLIEYNKEKKNIEKIRELTSLVEEKLNDINFLVRSKSLTVIYNLFRQDSVLKIQRNQIIKHIVERIFDKTIIVRKKAISILGEILLNHPFKNKTNFEEYEKMKNNEYIINYNNNYNFLNDINNLNNLNNNNIEEDCKIFVEIMSEGLKKMILLLETTVKSDLEDIIIFVKYAYFMKLNGWHDAIKRMVGFADGNRKQIIIKLFQELIDYKDNTIYELINIKGFIEIIKDLKLDTGKILKDFYNKNINEASLILSKMKNQISVEDGEKIIEYSTKILFSSQNENELKINIKLYVNTLKTLTRLIKRIESSHELLRTISKNAVKMIFFERSILKATVRLIYSISQNPEKNAGKLLNHLCLGKSVLKIINTVGWIAINEYYLLERLENSYKNYVGRGLSDKSTNNVIISLETNTEYKNFKNTINSAEFRDRRKSIEEGKRLSIGSKISLKMNGLNNQMKNKTEEEIADFFFYVKEKEIIYSKNSLLFQFMPLIFQSLSSTHSHIRITAYSTVFRLMMISSEFFFKNKNIISNALSDTLNSIRQNAVISLHDFYILYNSSLDSGFIFDLLLDPTIRKNVLLVIYSLLLKKIIRLKNNSTKLIHQISDPSSTSIVKAILKYLSSDNNYISTIFYEAFLESIPNDIIIYLCTLIDKKIHEPLFLKCLKTNISSDKIKLVFDHFEISEAFILKNAHNDKFTCLFPK